MVRKFVGKILPNIMELMKGEMDKKQDQMESLTAEDMKDMYPPFSVKEELSKSAPVQITLLDADDQPLAATKFTVKRSTNVLTSGKTNDAGLCVYNEPEVMTVDNTPFILEYNDTTVEVSLYDNATYGEIKITDGVAEVTDTDGHPHVHDYSYIDEVVQQPTITEEGVRYHQCYCGDYYTEPVPKISDPTDPLFLGEDNDFPYYHDFVFDNENGTVTFGHSSASVEGENVTTKWCAYYTLSSEYIENQQINSIVDGHVDYNESGEPIIGGEYPIPGKAYKTKFKTENVPELAGNPNDPSTIIIPAHIMTIIPHITNGDVKNVKISKNIVFDTPAVKLMNSFYENIDFSTLNTNGIIYMTEMFSYNYGSSSYGGKCPVINLKGIDTSNVTNMAFMFYGSDFEELDLTSFDTRNVKHMDQMFYQCEKLKKILVSRDKWVISDDCTTNAMFEFCGVDHVTYVD